MLFVSFISFRVDKHLMWIKWSGVQNIKIGSDDSVPEDAAKDR